MPPPTARRPAVMIAPSDWMSTASPLPAPTGVDTLPSLPNAGSSPGGGAGGAQWTATSVTSAPVTLPVPWLTVQTWSGPLGWVLTLTS